MCSFSSRCTVMVPAGPTGFWTRPIELWDFFYFYFHDLQLQPFVSLQLFFVFFVFWTSLSNNALQTHAPSVAEYQQIIRHWNTPLNSFTAALNNWIVVCQMWTPTTQSFQCYLYNPCMYKNWITFWSRQSTVGSVIRKWKPFAGVCIKFCISCHCLGL